MTEYEMNWQADAYQQKYELLNARVHQFHAWLNDPVISSFFIVGVVKDEYEKVFALPARD